MTRFGGYPQPRVLEVVKPSAGVWGNDPLRRRRIVAPGGGVDAGVGCALVGGPAFLAYDVPFHLKTTVALR